MNNVSLVGRLVRDPELKNTSNGIANTRFTLAVNRKYKNAKGEREADFITCVAWRQTAELASKYLSKGSQVGITGSIQTGSYEKDGQRVFTTEVIVDNVEFLESKVGQAQTKNRDKTSNFSESDLPF